MEQFIESYRAGYCPKCGGGSLHYGEFEIDGEELHIYFDCNECGFCGVEHYNLEYTASNGYYSVMD